MRGMEVIFCKPLRRGGELASQQVGGSALWEKLVMPSHRTVGLVGGLFPGFHPGLFSLAPYERVGGMGFVLSQVAEAGPGDSAMGSFGSFVLAEFDS